LGFVSARVRKFNPINPQYWVHDARPFMPLCKQLFHSLGRAALYTYATCLELHAGALAIHRIAFLMNDGSLKANAQQI
jgi:hypothetical protein